jgi:hypothetical protein
VVSLRDLGKKSHQVRRNSFARSLGKKSHLGEIASSYDRSCPDLDNCNLNVDLENNKQQHSTLDF